MSLETQCAVLAGLLLAAVLVCIALGLALFHTALASAKTEEALRSIAELGDAPWPEAYVRIRAVARAAIRGAR